MKKIAKTFCLIFSLLACVLFSACKVNYKKLEITFCSSSGDVINQIRLVIDENQNSNSNTTKIAVKFDGIKEKNIGDVLISALPNDLVEIGAISREGNKCFVDISATMQGSGKIVAQHLTSGKSASIDLVVDKKSTTVTKIVDNYAIAIPNLDTTNFAFDVGELISQDGTDQIGFMLADGVVLPDGVTLLTKTFNETELAVGLTLDATIAHGASIEIYPVLYMDGYTDLTKYPSQTIKLTFVKALTNESFVLTTDEAHSGQGMDVVFHLIAKDTDLATGGNYKFNDMKFNLNCKNGLSAGTDELLSLGSETTFNYLSDYYNAGWDIPTEFKYLIEVFEEDKGKIVIEAKDYASDVANITISLKPKVAGNLQQVDKTIKIKCDVKPTEYEISVQGKIQQNSGTKNDYNIDLYDYYNSAESVYGASFVFKPVMEYSYIDLKNIKIIVSPSILDVVRTNGEETIGTNYLNTNEQDTIGLDIATNRYLLQFYLNGKPILFNLDGNNQAVSEGIIYIEDLNNIQIKYTEISENADTEPLDCLIQNYYSGELEYLKTIKPTTATLHFNHKDGIKEMTIYGGVLTKSTGTGSADKTDTIEADGKKVVVNNVYLNRLDTKLNVVYIDEILGDKNKIVSNVNIDVFVVGSGENLLKIAQNKSNSNPKDKAASIIDYEYTGSTEYRSIIFCLDSTTDVGQYQILFKYADETIYTINCLVYEQLNSSKVNYTIENNSSLITNKTVGVDGQAKYEYPDYVAGYIVKADKSNTTNISIVLPPEYTSDYVLGYEFETSIDGATDVNINDYISTITVNNQLKITFIKGSVFNNNIGYINITMKIKTARFANILTRDDGAIDETTIFINFFVYETIEKNHISLNLTNIKGYWQSLLSPYYADQAKANLQVNLTDQNLWNFVQPQKQNTDTYHIGYDLVQFADNAIFDANETYYTVDGKELDATNKNATYFEEHKNELYIKNAEYNNYNVIWFTDEYHSITTTAQTQTGINLQFTGVSGSDTFYIYAMVKQFDLPEIIVRCQIEISEPIVTDKITITSETQQITGEYGKQVISLRAGQEYTMELEYYSNQFETLPTNERIISNPGFVMVIVDTAGNVYNNVVRVIDNKIIVASDFSLTADLKLLIFAKDALKNELDFATYELNNLSNVLMDEHNSAYLTIDLIVANGSEQNPYSIFNEQDFWAINSNVGKTKYYQLMNNIYLNDVETIDNFAGGINSYKNSGYTIYGVKLNNDVPNLFTNFNGKMSDVNFDVRYDYTIAATASKNLGLIDQTSAKAKLTNVCVNLSSTDLKVDGQTNVYVNFGGLVGKNEGTISYTNSTLTAARANVNISGDYLFFGGLVGENAGKISGYASTSTSSSAIHSAEQKVVFTSYVEDQGALASVNVYASGFKNGALGAAIGKNTGSLSNAYTTGEISSLGNKTLNNVGGVIGQNEHIEKLVAVGLIAGSTDIDKLTFANENIGSSAVILQNLKSSVQVQATDNIGGITGVDINGIYWQCKYQILSTSSYGIQANNNAGGIVGNATNTQLGYCSVYSYRWDYNDLPSIANDVKDLADITAKSASAGLIGFAMSTTTNNSIENGNYLIVAIKNSSINAFISGENINATIGQRGDKPNVVLDSYFAGKYTLTGTGSLFDIKGDDNGNGEQANANYAYVKTNEPNIEVGTITDVTGTSIERIGWAKEDGLNGDMPYILQIDETIKPIFDIAPTSITITIKDNAKFAVKDSEDNYLSNLVHLDLYDFGLNPNDQDYTQNYQTQTMVNTHRILDIYTISAEPAALLDEVRLTLLSQDALKVLISNGNLVARSSGATTITFTSVLNQAATKSTQVSVGKPIGETIELYLSRDSVTFTGNTIKPTNKTTIALTKGEAVLLNYYATGYNTSTGFYYNTNEQTWLHIEVETTSLPTGKSINNYLLISGQTLTLATDTTGKIPTNGSIKLSYNTPFSIKAIDKIEDVKFSFTVTPYIKIGDYTKLSNQSIYFDVETTSGISAIALDSENVILYPNDTTTITAILTTDKEFESSADLFKLIDHITLNSTTITETDALKKYLSVLSVGNWDESKNTQIVKFKLVIPQDAPLIENISNTMYIGFKAGTGLGTGAKCSLKLTLLKQRIDELVVRNYIYERNTDGTFDYNNYYQNNTLRPVNEGLITIDIAPINGNYDYIEISDITGTEEIVFVQTDGVHGRRILDDVVASADGKGIRLKSSVGGGTIYVASMIDANYSNRKHTVQVRAYVDDVMIKSTTMEIDVKMLPEVNIYLVNKDGGVNRSTATQYVAQNTKVRFKVETKNSDDVEPNVQAQVDSTNLTLTNEGNGYYSVSLPEYNDNNQRELAITASTQLTLDNGNVETSTISQSYQITNFVINNISVDPSTTSSANGTTTTKIYGNLSADVPIEFYFENADLTFYDNQTTYDKTTYSDIDAATTWYESAKQAIHNILTTLNSADSLDYLMLDISRVKTDDGKISLSDDKHKVTFTDNNGNETTVASLWFDSTSKTIKVNMTKDLDIDLVLNLPMKIENNNFVIATDDATLTLSYTYQLDFIEESSFLEPTAVRSEDEFLNMTSGGDYILAKDLTFDAYTPIDVDLNSFDGNGHTITINSFGLFSQADINAGLFSQIYEDMIVMNLTVDYNIEKTTYYDLCNDSTNVAYTSASFGGITATNNGVITNCKITGKLKVCASIVEQSVDDNSIDFYIGGLVCTNAGTGRITNSASELQITAKANIAGVVYSNSGKIASSYFDANTNKGKIYAYNNGVTVPYTIQVAGFVLENSSAGEISMSYVESQKASNIGSISAKDYSSGFVYTNSGNIYDCYADIELIGESSNNHIAGFVFENTGSIKNCYSYVNNGKKTNLISMFAPEKTTGITDCYEIKQDVAGYKNNVVGLTTISNLSRTYQSSYPTFAFGDNTNAVWTKTSLGMPKLASTQEKVEFTGSALPASDENKQYPQMYYGLKNLQLQIVETKNDLGVVTSREYKYKTIANNFGSKQNPILIYNLATWNYYLGQTDTTNSYYNNTKYYFRVINDINFETVYENPSTSNCTFNGNLQGNNMDIKNFKIYSLQNLSNIGLFGSLKSINNLSISSSVRNVHLIPISINATRTQAVGTLAGVSENYNLYNIQIDAAGLTIVGGNAVGGVVGLVCGKYDIDGIVSNVGAYSSRSQTDNSYNIYSSTYQNNTLVSNNLSSVYYAGGVFGVVDGITNQSKTDIDINTDKDLQYLRHITVDGNLILAGDTVGAAIGLLGKNNKLIYADINISGGNFSGYQYSAGLVGENRGIISNATANLNSNSLFNNSTNVSAGLVGFNLNGLIENVSIYAEITKTNQSVVAGVVGRNLNGYIENISFDGTLSGYIVGGVVGADYGVSTFVTRTSSGGAGAIKISKSNLESLAGSTYKDVNNFANLSLSKTCVDNFITNLSSYYTIKQSAEDKNAATIVPRKLFGLVVGLTDKTEIYSSNYGYNTRNKAFVVNGLFDINAIGCVQDSSLIENKNVTFGLMNIVNNYDLPTEYSSNYAILYLVGAKATSFDFWMYSGGYSSEVFAITKNANNLTTTQTDSSKQLYIKKTSGSIYKMSINDSYTFVSNSDTITDVSLSILNDDGVLIDRAKTDEEVYKKYKFSFNAINNVLKIEIDETT